MCVEKKYYMGKHTNHLRVYVTLGVKNFLYKINHV